MNHLEKAESWQRTPPLEVKKALASSSPSQGVIRGRVFTAGAASQPPTVFPVNTSCNNPSESLQRGRSTSLSMSSPSTLPVKKGSFRGGSPPSKQQIDLGQKFINGLNALHHSSEETPIPLKKSLPPSSSLGIRPLHSSLGNGSLLRSKNVLKKKASQIFQRKGNSEESCQTVPVSTPKEKEVIEDMPAYEKIRREWISSEEVFNDHLKVLVELKNNTKLESCHIFECVDNTSLQAVAREVLTQLLGEIEKLKSFSDLFLAALYDAPKFSKFVQLLAGLHYESFRDACKFYSIWLKTLTKLSLEERKLISEQLNSLIKSEEEIKLGFSDHAITLIQRLPKFPLFIDKLIEAIEDDPAFQPEIKLLRIAHNNTLFAVKKAEKAVLRATILFSPVVHLDTSSNQ